MKQRHNDQSFVAWRQPQTAGYVFDRIAHVLVTKPNTLWRTCGAARVQLETWVEGNVLEKSRRRIIKFI